MPRILTLYNHHFNFFMILFSFLSVTYEVFIDFTFSSSSEYSLKGAAELLSYVARQGEESGFGMPCLLIAAKNDLDSNPTATKDSVKVFDASFGEIFFSFDTRIRYFNGFCGAAHEKKL